MDELLLRNKLDALMNVIKNLVEFKSYGEKINLINLSALAELYLKNNSEEKYEFIGKKIDDELEKHQNVKLQVPNQGIGNEIKTEFHEQVRDCLNSVKPTPTVYKAPAL